MNDSNEFNNPVNSASLVNINCSGCNSPLCLRKRVVNLALDNIEEMYCLDCLGKINDRSPLDILLATRTYVLQRECFRKEWLKYENKAFCPEPMKCFIDRCFAE
jgi:hypothetical protein